MQLADNIDDNLQILLPLVKLEFLNDTIRQDLCLAQAIIESRLLGAPSSLAKDYNNLFGITATDGTHNPSQVNLPSHEYIDGEMRKQDRYFSWNNTLNDSIIQYKHILGHNRYKPVLEANTFEEAANQIRECGFASDPAYSKSLIQIYNQYLKDL